MSDTDDSGFDKEAERERLREKYGEEDREDTQRMSELLLQGATMTNQHCGDCGNPIFRYEGRSFCPVCQEERAPEETAAEPEAEGDSSPDGQEQAPQPRGAESDTQVGQPSQPVDTTSNSTSEPSEIETPARSREDSTTNSPTQSPTRSADDPVTEGDDDLSAARASLRRTLRDSAARAEQTGDGRGRRDHLEAAREAAEALAALDRVRQS